MCVVSCRARARVVLQGLELGCGQLILNDVYVVVGWGTSRAPSPSPPPLVPFTKNFWIHAALPSTHIKLVPMGKERGINAVAGGDCRLLQCCRGAFVCAQRKEEGRKCKK